MKSLIEVFPDAGIKSTKQNDHHSPTIYTERTNTHSTCHFKWFYLLLFGERLIKIGHLSFSGPASPRKAHREQYCHGGHNHNRSEDADWSTRGSGEVDWTASAARDSSALSAIRQMLPRLTHLPTSAPQRRDSSVINYRAMQL